MFTNRVSDLRITAIKMLAAPKIVLPISIAFQPSKKQNQISRILGLQYAVTKGLGNLNINHIDNDYGR